jgi:hypothetical protein
LELGKDILRGRRSAVYARPMDGVKVQAISSTILNAPRQMWRFASDYFVRTRGQVKIGRNTKGLGMKISGRQSPGARALFSRYWVATMLLN